MNILQSIKFRTGLVFMGLVLVMHATLAAIGELLFASGIIWVLFPFLGLYGLAMGSGYISVTKACADVLCEPNILGWFVLAFNVIVALAVFYSTAKYITRRFWKGGSI